MPNLEKIREEFYKKFTLDYFDFSEESEKIWKWIEAKIFEAVSSAKKEERERIIGILEKFLPDKILTQEEALKKVDEIKLDKEGIRELIEIMCDVRQRNVISKALEEIKGQEEKK